MLVLILLLAAYGNTFSASWHMDDFPNILNNPAVQMTNWGMAPLLRAMGIDQAQGNNLSRPVANLSFAFNWCLHGANIAGFHLVNLIIHIYNALLVYAAIILLGTAPGFPNRHRAHAHSIALGAGLLWALNPIQTQAVTYVVQRMTSLATLFYLAALIAYLKLRLTNAIRQKIWWGIGTGAAFLLALGTKENAATLPLAIVLTEWIFFRKKTDLLFDRQIGIVIAAGVIFTMLFVALFFLWSGRDIGNVLTKSFEMRPFSQIERVLTQPRVLLFYLSLLFYPIPQRLSLEHDFTVSTSLWHPWSTFPAILGVGLLIALGVYLARKRPLLAFAILFFFLSHAVESSFLPLEMVFEHRNYLPSVFLFLPIAAVWMDVKAICQSRNRQLGVLLQVFSFLIPILLLAGTYARNLDWQSEGRLWADAHLKAPGRARPVFNLAKDLERRGHYKQAIILYEKSMTLVPPRRKHFEIMALTNIGTIFYKANQHDKAIDYYRKALELLPETVQSRYNLAVAYANAGQFAKSEEHVSWLLGKNRDDKNALDLMGFILLKQYRLEESLRYSRRLLRLELGSRSANLQIGAAFTQMQLLEKGAWFLSRAYLADPDNVVTLLCLLENRLMCQDNETAQRIAADLLNRHSLDTLRIVLHDSVNEVGNSADLLAYLVDAKNNRAMNDQNHEKPQASPMEGK